MSHNGETIGVKEEEAEVEEEEAEEESKKGKAVWNMGNNDIFLTKTKDRVQTHLTKECVTKSLNEPGRIYELWVISDTLSHAGI